MRYISLFVLALLMFTFQNFHPLLESRPVTVFKSYRGKNLSNNKRYYYRIPAIVTHNQSKALIAFAEERVRHNNDYGDINVVYRVSLNHGATWTKIKRVCELGPHTCGNPTAVVDEETGLIHLFMNQNDKNKSQFTTPSYSKIGEGDRKILYTQGRIEKNGSISFSDIEDLTHKLQFRGTKFDLVGPGVGIQLQGKRYKGRLIIPAARRSFYSDDNGESWHLSKQMNDMSSETSIVELPNGQIFRNDRMTGKYKKNGKLRRVTSFSTNGGESFSNPKRDPFLYDPVSQGSMLKYTKSKIFFANCASTKRRRAMTIRMTQDGKNWHNSKKIDEDCGYSSMTKTRDYNVGILYEKSTGEKIYGKHTKDLVFRKFKLKYFFR